MSCQEFEEMLSAYIDGEMSSKEKEALERHLATCDSCRSVLLELQTVKDALKAAPEEEFPEELHATIMRKAIAPRPGFGEQMREKVLHWTYRQWVPVIAGAMALVIVVSAGSGIWYANSRHQISMEQALYGSADDGAKFSMYDSAEEGASKRSAAPESPEAVAGAPGEGLMTTKSLAQTDLATGSSTVVSADEKIIKRAQISLEVSRGKVREASELAVNAVKANFGYIESSSMAESQYDEQQYINYYMVARVPAENLDPVIEQISALGHTLRQDTSGENVTDQYVDLEARLRNKKNQEERLLSIMGEAETVGELLQVEGELSRVRGEIESMQAQKDNYDQSVSLSTVSLTLTEEGAIKPVQSPWGDVWRTFLNAWRSLLIVLAKAAPTLILLAVIVGIVVYIRRRRPA